MEFEAWYVKWEHGVGLNSHWVILHNQWHRDTNMSSLFVEHMWWAVNADKHSQNWQENMFFGG